jgi:peptidoglycan/xylan/chitin deacetylase (PgdA/CDA1 family)
LAFLATVEMKTQKITFIIICIAIAITVIGCSSTNPQPSLAEIALATAEKGATLTLEVLARTPTNTPFIPPTNTPTPIATSTPTETPTPLPTATPAMIFLPSGSVTAPILLYHHVDTNGKDSRYFVEPAMFEQQMQWLYDHGYRTITISTLIDVIKNGGEIPERPVVITFDDGDVSVYTNAFPIMQKYGFVGVFYLISRRLGGTGVVTVDQVRTLLQAGWEIGSHSQTHVDLTLDHSVINAEMAGSRTDLETTFTVPVNTFAYPYGKVDDVVTGRAYKYGYLGAMGLGTSYTHTTGSLFYLSREEVRFEYDLNKFISLLPWQQ